MSVVAGVIFAYLLAGFFVCSMVANDLTELSEMPSAGVAVTGILLSAILWPIVLVIYVVIFVRYILKTSMGNKNA